MKGFWRAIGKGIGWIIKRPEVAEGVISVIQAARRKGEPTPPMPYPWIENDARLGGRPTAPPDPDPEP